MNRSIEIGKFSVDIYIFYINLCWFFRIRGNMVIVIF